MEIWSRHLRVESSKVEDWKIKSWWALTVDDSRLIRYVWLARKTRDSFTRLLLRSDDCVAPTKMRTAREQMGKREERFKIEMHFKTETAVRSWLPVSDLWTLMHRAALTIYIQGTFAFTLRIFRFDQKYPFFLNSRSTILYGIKIEINRKSHCAWT